MRNLGCSISAIVLFESRGMKKYDHVLVVHPPLSDCHSIPWCSIARLIIDLSHQKNHSVNDRIPKDLCSIKYITIEEAIKDVITLGKVTMLAKVDIKSAFRLLLVHPVDRHLLGMEWLNNTFIDMCLPFGLRCAPKLFNILADLLTWIFKQQGVFIKHHYLDDFLTLGSPSTNICHENLATIQHTCKLLGVLEKVYGPSTQLSFLGIILDTIRMEACLPVDKLLGIKQMTTSWLDKKNTYNTTL